MDESVWMLVAVSPSRGALEKLARMSGGVCCHVMPLRVTEPTRATGPPGRRDPLYSEAVEMVARQGVGSISMLQRVFEIGYNRAARIMEAMASEGIVGQHRSGGHPRVVTPPEPFGAIC